jgi:hypothetical protein
MHTVTVDERKRVRLPDAKPGQVLAYENLGGGSFSLTAIKAERKEMFPRGSLVKYLTKKRDEEQLVLAKGCIQEPE